VLICGIKLTHDGAVALIDGGRLVASVEVEKLDNQPRYADLGDLDVVDRVLAAFGYAASDVDSFVVDGWGYGEPRPTVQTAAAGTGVSVNVAPYREADLADDSAFAYEFDGLPLPGGRVKYTSYHHSTGHVMAAYSASPFAAQGQPSFVLVWDGGMLPRGYYVEPRPFSIQNLGPILGLLGNIYPRFAMRFPPFRPQDLGGPPEREVYHQLTVPGKVMAYTALGHARDDLASVLDDICDHGDLPMSLEYGTLFADEFLRRTAGQDVPPADALASFQAWLGGRLVQALSRLRHRYPNLNGNLCLSGGCALNIKWNSEVRASGLFDRVWVPPFPNDSGSAIGTACVELARRAGITALDWSVYRGPQVTAGGEIDGYRAQPADSSALAELLHTGGEPVLVMHGRAELGPRALGNRSILAPATDPAMKDTLNAMKGREPYRPVSPVCLEHRAADLFDPGTPDPFMLFEHGVRPHWRSRIPAVIHLDGSARLQTVTAAQNELIADLLTEYERRSGIPVLCNTSANFNGSGFFPDVASAARWGRARYIWSDGTLWTRVLDAG
jgi:carbamoyltransferase